MHIPRIVRQLLISTLVLSLLLVITGAGYALYSDRSTSAQPLPETTDVSVNAPPIKHVAPSSNAPASAAVQGITSPVKAGDEASINIQTLAGAVCTVVIGYTGAPSNDATFAQSTADEYGAVSWNWRVATSAPIGSWPVKTTCVYHNRSAVVEATLQISK